MRRLIVLSTLAVLVAASPAAAQDPPVPAPQPAPEPAPAPAPAGGRLKVTPDRVGKDVTVLAGKRWQVRGEVVPYVEGQTVVVRFFRSGKKILAKQVAVTPGASGKAGHFVVPFTTKVAGTITVRATKPASPTQLELKAKAKQVLVLPLRVSIGSTGERVRILQRQLKALGYVPGRRGLFDQRTARAVLAFRKVSGLPRTSVADPTVFRRLASGGGHFKVRFPSHGRHVEADLSRQIVVLVNGKRVERIYPTSSGKPSTPTVLGHYRFYSKLAGYNAKGMYFSSFFIRGYAIHGYHDVPIYNASHGCLRVPIPDAYSIYQWVRIGDRIDVYA
jgi:peptidoglycan hydrolase-like protein with peptidoglycan-binding domain